MKLSQSLQDALKSTGLFLRNNFPVFITFLVVFLGALTAYTLFKVLAGTTPSAAENKAGAKGKDTVYVKLVDSLPLAAPAARGGLRAQSGEEGDRVGRLPDTLRAQGGDRWRKAVPIGKLDAGKVTTPKNPPVSLWKWLFIPLVLVIAGTAIFLSYKKLPPVHDKLAEDKDPEELTYLFERHGGKIELLGNPRKIKRFSNKVRFQYHYLKNQKLIVEANDLDEMLLTLLYIENHLHKMNLDHLTEAEKRDTLAWFKNLLQTEAQLTIDDKLAKHLLQLNKNLIA